MKSKKNEIILFENQGVNTDGKQTIDNNTQAALTLNQIQKRKM